MLYGQKLTPIPSVPDLEISTLILNTDPVACLFAARAKDEIIRFSSSGTNVKDSFLIFTLGF
jgi:hypothetical protein